MQYLKSLRKFQIIKLKESSEIVIDGYFGDWMTVEKQFNIISTAESEHIDLQNYAAVEQNNDAFMYLVLAETYLMEFLFFLQC